MTAAISRFSFLSDQSYILVQFGLSVFAAGSGVSLHGGLIRPGSAEGHKFCLQAVVETGAVHMAADA